VSGRFDHSTIVVSDLDVSQRLYCDGLGLVPVFDQVAGGDWRRIFGVATDSLRAILLADPNDPSAALLELIVFDDGLDRKTIPKQGAPHRGLASPGLHFDVMWKKLARDLMTWDMQFKRRRQLMATLRSESPTHIFPARTER
jgi:catechol 2,3-dioxygenase-like lactoylglutathione lyase family enzyme